MKFISHFQLSIEMFYDLSLSSEIGNFGIVHFLLILASCSSVTLSRTSESYPDLEDQVDFFTYVTKEQHLGFRSIIISSSARLEERVANLRSEMREADICQDEHQDTRLKEQMDELHTIITNHKSNTSTSHRPGMSSNSHRSKHSSSSSSH